MNKIILGTVENTHTIPADIWEALGVWLREEFPEAESIDIWAVVDASKNQINKKTQAAVSYCLRVMGAKEAGILEFSPSVTEELGWTDGQILRVRTGLDGKFYLLKPDTNGFPVKIKASGAGMIRLPWPKSGFWKAEAQATDDYRVENGKISFSMKQATVELYEELKDDGDTDSEVSPVDDEE